MGDAALPCGRDQKLAYSSHSAMKQEHSNLCEKDHAKATRPDFGCPACAAAVTRAY
jgi:hypothetical protein